MNPAQMEESLAREMARMKMDKEKQNREVEKICAESDELKELQAKIKAAYLNKERATQVAENQYRKQVDLVRKLLGVILLGVTSGDRANNVAVEGAGRDEPEGGGAG